MRTDLQLADMRASVLDAHDDVWVVSVPMERSVLDALTLSQREVALLVLVGMSNVEIAAQRHTSPRTVANQLRAVYRRFGVTSRAELAIAIDRGRLLRPAEGPGHARG